MQNKPSEEQKEQKESQFVRKISGPELIAKYFKFYRQKIDTCISKEIPFQLIREKSFYLKNRKIFDTLYSVIEKYGINSQKFIKFCVLEKRCWNPKDLINVENFRMYAINLKINEQSRNIYDDFIKSAKYVAKECIKENIGVSEYFSNLVSENRLAYEYFCGNISKHYIANLNGFKEIYFKLDEPNRQELSIIYDATEELNNMLQDVFLKYKNIKVHAVKFTEAIITKLKITNNKENKLCVH